MLPRSNLGARPQKLDEFAAYYSQFSGVMGGKEAIERRYAVVLTMYEMLTEYGGKVPPTDQVRLAHAPRTGQSRSVDAWACTCRMGPRALPTRTRPYLPGLMETTICRLMVQH